MKAHLKRIKSLFSLLLSFVHISFNKNQILTKKNGQISKETKGTSNFLLSYRNYPNGVAPLTLGRHKANNFRYTCYRGRCRILTLQAIQGFCKNSWGKYAILKMLGAGRGLGSAPACYNLHITPEFDTVILRLLQFTIRYAKAKSFELKPGN